MHRPVWNLQSYNPKLHPLLRYNTTSSCGSGFGLQRRSARYGTAFGKRRVQHWHLRQCPWSWKLRYYICLHLFFDGLQLTAFTALLAKDILIEILSPGLPSNQWTLEVTRWFTTSLAKIQSSIIEYASNDQDLGPYAYINSPDTFNDQPPAVRTAFQAQCKTQRIQSSREVQSFSVLRFGIVLGTMAILVFTSLALDSCMKITRRWRRSVSHRAAARQADEKLHLLRMALGDQSETGMH
jgi:hypothetical protein